MCLGWKEIGVSLNCVDVICRVNLTPSSEYQMYQWKNMCPFFFWIIVHMLYEMLVESDARVP